MAKIYRSDVVDEMPPMKAVLTGTHVYGPVTAWSDIDIVVVKEDALKIKEFLRERDISMRRTEEQEMYGELGGFYFDIAGLEFNIIVAIDEQEQVKWKETTKIMKRAEPIEDRDERVALFEEIMKQLGG